MLANTLIIIGIAIALCGAWLKYQERKESRTAQVEAAAPPKATNEEKGHAFEKWVVSHLSKQHHALKDWRSDKIAPNGMYAESNQLPDVKVMLKLQDKEYPFAMECKWRQSFMGMSVELSEEQIMRYRAFEMEEQVPVFLVLGVGGKPDAPAELYTVPVRVLQTGKLSMERLAPYRQGMTRSTFYFDPFERKLSY